MKRTLFSYCLLLSALAALAAAVIATPPGGLSWQYFFDEAASPAAKGSFLARVYLLPAIVSFLAITLFQLQFRLSTSGARREMVFSICLLASLATLLGLQRLSMAPNSAPAYALGMALGYMAMSRLYAVRMRKVWRDVAVPWIVWRGNLEAVRQMDHLAAQIRDARSKVAAGAGSRGAN